MKTFLMYPGVQIALVKLFLKLVELVVIESERRRKKNLSAMTKIGANKK